MNINELVSIAAQENATDVFITADAFPAFRVNRVVEIKTCLPKISAEDCQNMVYGIMTHEQISRFERRNDLDLAFAVPGVVRVRANVYRQRQTLAMALRLIPIKVPTLEDLNMPQSIADMVNHRQGLILVTGPTGSGKSTTLAAMIDLINRTRKCHIITIEDPVEYMHTNNMSVISQREVGIDVDSFSDALRYCVRQNPDVILIGEMRDPETMHVAMSAAETGHLVMSTLHTPSASETLERVISMFPPHDKAHVGIRLSTTLRGIVSQKLVNKANNAGTIAAVEIMIGTPTISKLLGEGKAHELYDAMEQGEYWGMQTMNQCLLKYVKDGLISPEEAESNSPNLAEFKQMMRR